MYGPRGRYRGSGRRASSRGNGNDVSPTKISLRSLSERTRQKSLLRAKNMRWYKCYMWDVCYVSHRDCNVQTLLARCQMCLGRLFSMCKESESRRRVPSHMLPVITSTHCAADSQRGSDAPDWRCHHTSVWQRRSAQYVNREEAVSGKYIAKPYSQGYSEGPSVICYVYLLLSLHWYTASCDSHGWQDEVCQNAHPMCCACCRAQRRLRMTAQGMCKSLFG